ncbi:MAG: hypothetical protein EBZ77_08505 [Chitinophagia bacterium]|nr:hypothetical protein [Chitinophagia bacterium]
MRHHLEFYYTNNGISEDLLELLDISESCLWLVDRSYTLLAFNKLYAMHMELYAQKTPFCGQYDIILSCFPSDFASNIKLMYDRAFNGEFVRESERGFNADGSPTEVQMLFKPNTDAAGNVVSVTCKRKDISEIVAIQHKLSGEINKMNAISWEQSHFVRGPLATAMGIAGLLREETETHDLTDAECRELVQHLAEKLQELDTNLQQTIRAINDHF